MHVSRTRAEASSSGLPSLGPIQHLNYESFIVEWVCKPTYLLHHYMIKHYELLYILPGNKTEEEAQIMVQSVREIVKQQGGTMVKEDFWGKRKLAYEINHLSHGYYDLVLFQIESTKLQALENILRLNEHVVRHQVTSFIVKSPEKLAAEERLRERIAARRQADKEKEVASAIVADNAPAAPSTEPVVIAPMDSAQLDKKLEEILEEDKLDV